jgi:hypothetical protein
MAARRLDRCGLGSKPARARQIAAWCPRSRRGTADPHGSLAASAAPEPLEEPRDGCWRVDPDHAVGVPMSMLTGAEPLTAGLRPAAGVFTTPVRPPDPDRQSERLYAPLVSPGRCPSIWTRHRRASTHSDTDADTPSDVLGGQGARHCLQATLGQGGKGRQGPAVLVLASLSSCSLRGGWSSVTIHEDPGGPGRAVALLALGWARSVGAPAG